MVSSIAFKIAITAAVALIVMLTVDHANGTLDKRSPSWIAIPGGIVALTFLAASVVGVLALVWGF